MSSDRPRNPLRGLVGLGVNLLLVAGALLAVAYVAPAVLGFERYAITGGSMAGTIDKGSLVLTRPVPVDELEVGDVITYLPPADSGVQTLVTHRITRIGHDAAGRPVLRTQGDANPDPDPWKFRLVDTEQPVVEHSVPYAGHALIALADRQTRMLLVGGPAGLVALTALGQLVAALRELRRGRRREVPNRGAPVAVASTAGGARTSSVDTNGSADRRPRIPALAGAHRH